MLRFERKPLSAVSPLSDIVGRWERLILQSDVNPSMHPIWVAAIAQAKDLFNEIMVFLAWNDSELVVAVPYYRKKLNEWGLVLNAIELAGNLLCYHHEIVATRAHSTIMNALLAEAKD